MATDLDLLNASFASYVIPNANNGLDKLSALGDLNKAGFFQVQDAGFTIDKPSTGLYVTTYKKTATDGTGDEYIIAFRGTESLTDLAVDLDVCWFQYGPDQAAIQSLVSKVTKLSTQKRVSITGHSLGGALAQFAAYDFVMGGGGATTTNANALSWARAAAALSVTFETWNAPGGKWAEQANRTNFDEATFNSLTKDAKHFYGENDLVSRFGGAHLGGNMFQLIDPTPVSSDVLKTLERVAPLAAHGYNRLLQGYNNAKGNLIQFAPVDHYFNVPVAARNYASNFGRTLVAMSPLIDAAAIAAASTPQGQILRALQIYREGILTQLTTTRKAVKSTQGLSTELWKVSSEFYEKNILSKLPADVRGASNLSTEAANKLQVLCGQIGDGLTKFVGPPAPAKAALAQAPAASSTGLLSTVASLPGLTNTFLGKLNGVSEAFQLLKTNGVFGKIKDGTFSLDDLSFLLNEYLAMQDFGSSSVKAALSIAKDGGLGVDLTFDKSTDTGVSLSVKDAGIGKFLTVEGELQAKVSQSITGNLSLGVRGDGSFYVNSAPAGQHALTLAVDVPLSGTFDAKLANFLDFTASFRSDKNPATNKAYANGLHAEIGVDIDKSKFSLSAPTGALDLNVHLEASIAKAASILPRFTSNLAVHWDLFGKQAPSIELDDVYLDFSSFLNGLVKGGLGSLAPILEKIKKGSNVLIAPISALKSVGINASLLDVAIFLDYANGGNGKGLRDAKKFIANINSVASLLSSASDLVGSNSRIKLGDFKLQANQIFNIDTSTTTSLGVLTEKFDKGLESINGVITALQNAIPEPVTESKVSSVTSKFSAGGIYFPMLDDPSKAVGFLLGQTQDIFRWNPPSFEFTAGYQQTIPLGPLSLSGRIFIGGQARLGVGFDTSGFAKYLSYPSGNRPAGTILQGLYLTPGWSDLKNNQLSSGRGGVSVTAGIELKAGIDLGIVGAWIGAGVYGSVGLYVRETRDHRLLHLSDVGSEPGQVPSLFQFQGRIWAAVFGEVKVRLLFITKTWRWEKQWTLVTFGEADYTNPKPASLVSPAGELTASDKKDVPDIVSIVTHVKTASEKADPDKWELWNGSNRSLITKDQLDKISKVSLLDGDDSFQDQVSLKQNLTVSGGLGNDTIRTGLGADSVDGGAGNDALDGAAGNNTLVGGAGDDMLKAGAGNDSLSGGDGADVLDGGAGLNTLLGGAGSDEILGGSGNDWIVGGAGGDFIFGGAGVNTLVGGEEKGDPGDLASGEVEDVFDVSAGQNVVYGGSIDKADNGYDVASYRVQEIDSVLNYFAGDSSLISVTQVSITGVDSLKNLKTWLDSIPTNPENQSADTITLLGNLLQTLNAPFVFGKNAEGKSYETAANELEKLKSILSLEKHTGVVVDIAHQENHGGEAQGDTLYGIEQIEGTDYDDNIVLSRYATGQAYESVAIGNRGNDTLIGWDDTGVSGGANYVFEGGEGADSLVGGAGLNSAVYRRSADPVSVNLKLGTATGGEAEGDVLVNISRLLGSGFNDTLVGNDNGNTLAGNAGDDSLVGGEGADLLDGGTNGGVVVDESQGLSVPTKIPSTGDTMRGGAGDDTYVVDSPLDRVIEDSMNEPVYGDMVQAHLSYTLPGGVENVSIDVIPRSDETFQRWYQTTVANVSATDKSAAGAVPGLFVPDLDLQGNPVDLLRLKDPSDATYFKSLDIRNENGERVSERPAQWNEILIPIAASGNELDNVIYGNDFDNSLYGGAGSDLIYGSDSDVVDNVRESDYKGKGNDYLDGGEGPDQMIGGVGNDTYVVDGAGDQVHENLNEGTDTVLINFPVPKNSTFVDFKARNFPNVEAFRLATASSGKINASQSNSVSLFGGQYGDSLIGGKGGDYLDGGGAPGGDTLFGGLGNDTYRVYTDRDVINEDSGGGTDGITASINVDLWRYNTVENATLLGGVGENGKVPEWAYGNGRNNLLVGNASDNSLYGGAGNDTLVGGGGNDAFYHDAGDDSLVGGDTGVGSVDYSIIGEDAELPGSFRNSIFGQSSALNGVATVTANLSQVPVLDGNILASVAANTIAVGRISVVLGKYTAGFTERDSVRNIRNVTTGNGNDTLVGAGGETRDLCYSEKKFGLYSKVTLDTDKNWLWPSVKETLCGGGGADSIVGNGGGDVLSGGAGDDILTLGRLFLTTTSTTSRQGVVTTSTQYSIDSTLKGEDGGVIYGGEGKDSLMGMSGNDFLDGGSGIDTLLGGLGDDTYVFDDLFEFKTSSEDQTAGGTDLVYSSVSNLSSPALKGGLPVVSAPLPAGLENLVLTGTAALSGAGNDLDNFLVGNSADNSLLGGKGKDTLFSAGGNDTLLGGEGDDWFVIDNGQTSVLEDAKAGIDTVIARNCFDWTLPANVENVDYSYAAGAPKIDLGIARDPRQADGQNGLYPTLYGGTKLVVSGVNSPESGDLGAWITGNQADNLITGTTRADTIVGGDGNNTLRGGGGADSLVGGSGSDTLSSAWRLGGVAGGGRETGYTPATDTGAPIAFASTLAGGDGNDYYEIRNAWDVIKEGPADPNKAGSGGLDSVLSWVDFTLPNNVENLTLAASVKVGLSQLVATVWTGVGNASPNSLVGNDSNNSLVGNGGNDTIAGFAGNDTLSDGAGSDSLDGGDGNDLFLVSELSMGKDVETDTFVGGNGNDTVSFAGCGGAVYVNLTTPSDKARWGVGHFGVFSGLENVVGGSGADTLLGSPGNNLLDGGAAGIDSLVGGAGNDTYVVDNPKDVLLESSTIATEVDAVWSTVDWTLGNNLENLVLIGSDPISGTGNKLANSLTGNAGPNSLVGGDGNDTLDGGGGLDVLVGGAGDDVYLVNDANAAVVEQANGGKDVVYTTLSEDDAKKAFGNSYENLPNVEEVRFITADGKTRPVNIAGVSLGLLPLKPVIRSLVGGGRQVIDKATYQVTDSSPNLALAGNDPTSARGDVRDNVLTGNVGANGLVGGDGNDTLDGGVGGDTLVGGLGNDWCVVDSNLDVILEADKEGVDTVQASITYSLVGTFLESVVLSGAGGIHATGNSSDNTLVGNTGANSLIGLDGNDSLDGGSGLDTLVGGNGDDTYVVREAGQIVREDGNANSGSADLVQAFVNYALADNTERLQLMGGARLSGVGNALANTLTGNDGANSLDGGLGEDLLVGGAGNDTYYVDQFGDNIMEKDGEGSADVVIATCSYILPNFVENLILDGVATTGVGNSLANSLVGNASANTLIGGDGMDTLDGKEGIDSLLGGAGSDVYLVDNSKDVVLDTGVDSSEQDSVWSSVTCVIPKGIESLVLTGTASIHGTGNESNNSLLGNSAANSLVGGLGKDSLDGGAGNDTLRGFDAVLGLCKNEIDQLTGGDGADLFVLGDKQGVFYDDGLRSDMGLADYAVIKDFTAGVDRLQLKGSASSYFIGSSAFAGMPVDREQASVGLFFDSNVNGKKDEFDEFVAVIRGSGTVVLTAENVIKTASFAN